MNKKYLKFVVLEEKPKTKVFSVMSKNSDIELAIVKWNQSWRKYCFFPTTDFETVFDSKCLSELVKFLDNINELHKNPQRSDRKNGRSRS